MAPSISVWAGLGRALRPLLNDPGRVHASNLALAILLVLSMLAR